MRKQFKETAIGLSAAVLGVALDKCVAPEVVKQYPEYVGYVRDAEHVLAGIGVPYLMERIFDPMKKSGVNKFLYYGAIAAIWEIKQAVDRGYVQLDQVMCDIVGIGVAYSIDKLFLNDNALESSVLEKSIQNNKK